MKSDGELLSEYAKADCEEAFAELVQRHVNLVYSAALRQVNGDTPLAEDVAQRVFTDLARKAAALARHPVLTGWLYTSTHFAAAKAVRAECRRRTHEQEAQAMHELLQQPAPEPTWEKLGPVLDQLMHELNDSDRQMILMRYFENRRLSEIGERFGQSEDAVRKRVERGLERLRQLFVKRGITTTASLASLISANAVQAAPAGLAATLATSALAGTALTAATAATLTKTVAMTTLQKTFIVSTFVAVVAAGVYEAQQASRLRGQVRVLQQRQAALTEQIERLNSANTNLSHWLAQEGSSGSVSTERLRELLRLRGEVGVLRRQQRELERGLAEAQARGPQNAALRVPAQNQPAAAPAPFQVQLVADAPGDQTELMTNTASGDNGEAVYLNKAPLMDYTALRSAAVTTNATSGEPEISVELSEEGRELFAAITRDHINQRLAIVLSGKLYAAPVIRSEISDGKALLTGNFTPEEAKQLVAKINEAIPEQ